MDANEKHTEGFIPAHGGYRNLITFQKAEIIYDGTMFFAIVDYEDFLRTNKLTRWDRNHRLSLRFDELNKTPNANYDTFKKAIEHEEAGISANVLRSLSKVNIYLLGQQIVSLEKAFIKEGGLRERMTNARLQHRNKNKPY